MELWDILDKDGNKTGRTKVRGEILRRDEFHLVSHIWIKNSKNEYLIQKRSPTVKAMPNIWAITGGSAVSGEEALESAVREVEEELGLIIDPNEFKKINRVTRGRGLVYVWIIYKDIDLTKCKLQKEEVSSVKFKLKEEIIDMVYRGQFYDYGDYYFNMIFNYKL